MKRSNASARVLGAAETQTLSSTQDARVLERLLVVCADGTRGYRHAAAAVGDPAIRRVLARNGAQREEIESVLTYALVELGHKPAHHGSIAGIVHRAWLDGVAVVSSHDPRAVLRECERGERETIEAFTSALGRSLPENLHGLVQSQLGRVLEASAALRQAHTMLEGAGD